MGETVLDFAVDVPFDDADLARSRHRQGGRRITAWIAIAATCAMALLVLSLRQPVSPPLFPEAFPTSTGLVGYWTGDNSSLAATTGPDLTGSTTYVNGVIGKAFNLSANQLVTTQLPAVSDAVSVMMWVKPSPDTKSSMSLATRSTGPGLTGVLDDRHSFDLWLDPSGVLVWQTDDVSSRVPEELRVSVPTIFDGAFHLVAATWDTTAFRIYMDGTLVASKASQGGPLHAAPTTPFRLGGGFSYTGAIDDASIWSRALSPSEITSYYLSSITATQVAAGGGHSCALLTNTTVKCWGGNIYGQLGNALNTFSWTTPVTVTGITSATAITAGYYHSCALLADTTVKCWGNNLGGQLGNGTNIDSNTAVTVTGITGATAITAGYYHSCALLADTTVKCWGSSGYGQLGNGTNIDSNTAVTVTGITGATAITAGYYHSCALLADTTVKCWGNNFFGGLGNGTPPNSSNTAVTVTGITGATAITAGIYHSCALMADTTVKCWGNNFYGQLGNGPKGSSSTAATVNGIIGVTAITAAYGHSCAVLADATVKCWGYNLYGQLGDATNTDSNTAVTVTGITGATAITAGQFHSCGLRADTTIKCWGYNLYGQLGDGTDTNSNTPVSVIGL